MTRHCLPWFVIAALVSGSGCVKNEMYRPDPPGGADASRVYFAVEELEESEFDPTYDSDEATKNDRKPPAYPYRLAFVEFDDQGELFMRAQLDRAVAEIEAAKATAQQAGGRATVVVFVHGWKNNASDGSGNVWGFRRLLAGMSRQYNGRTEPVIGVYIGWRGAVVSAPLVKEFTFFDRYRKAKNLPSAHLVEALVRMMQAARGPDYRDPEESTRTLLIGHSFGGAVLETALSQTLVGLASTANGTGTGPHWPANLMLLVNEAQEALRSYQLIDAFARHLPRRNDTKAQATTGCVAPSREGSPLRSLSPDRPLIVSVSSTGDYATRAAFPAAQTLRRPFNSLRKYSAQEPNILGFESQRPMFLGTTAHRREFQSHFVGRCTCAVARPTGDECARPENLTCDDPVVEDATERCAVDMISRLRDDGQPGASGEVRDDDRIYYVLVEKPNARNRTPYWVMQMPPSVVPDHSTIFTPVFRDFAITLLQLATTD